MEGTEPNAFRLQAAEAAAGRLDSQSRPRAKADGGRPIFTAVPVSLGESVLDFDFCFFRYLDLRFDFKFLHLNYRGAEHFVDRDLLTDYLEGHDKSCSSR